jgi:GNAT superfamily N-acetyltransferase
MQFGRMARGGGGIDILGRMALGRSSDTGYVVRRAEAGDILGAYAVFRRSLAAHLHRLGVIDSPAVSDEMVVESWAIRRTWIEHLWRTAAENWVAVESGGRVVGWAQSAERDEHLELTFFFVNPDVQSKGMGRALLDQAFPRSRALHRAIFATQDPRALSLYLRSGVRFVTTVVDFSAKPRPAAVATDLDIESVTSRPTAIEAIAGIETAILGHRRDIDVAFLLDRRPAWLARRDGNVVGFAFGASGDTVGPLGVLEPLDMPALLAVVENQAAQDGIPELFFSTPLANAVAVDYFLGRGYRIDPFVAAILADDLSMHLDRWIHTNPSYIL